uniref:Uncharacterized protein n=1 Tax=Octopus bimaculoides TaxID=37653 RepID=A0A0L8FRK0_OCTBM
MQPLDKLQCVYQVTGDVPISVWMSVYVLCVSACIFVNIDLCQCLTNLLLLVLLFYATPYGYQCLIWLICCALASHF